MNTLKNKTLALILTATLGLTFGASSVNAQEVSIDGNLTQLIIKQGQHVAKELSKQLSTAIATELKSFSIENSITLSSLQTTDLTIVNKGELAQIKKQDIKNSSSKKIAE